MPSRRPATSSASARRSSISCRTAAARSRSASGSRSAPAERPRTSRPGSRGSGFASGSSGVVGDDPFGRLLARRLGAEGVECAPALRVASARPVSGSWRSTRAGERSFFSPNARFSADKLLAPRRRGPRAPRAAPAGSTWARPRTCCPDGQDGAPRGGRRRARARRARLVRPERAAPPLGRRRAAAPALRGGPPVLHVREGRGRRGGALHGRGRPRACGGAARRDGGRDRRASRSARTARSSGAAPRSCAVPAERVEVVDTTGAGDAFVAGFLSVLARAGSPRAPDRADARARGGVRVPRRRAGRGARRSRRRTTPRGRDLHLTSRP